MATLLFIEKNQENAAALVEELDKFRASYTSWPTNVVIEVINASFDDQMRNVIAMLEEQKTHLAPTFAFVDPFGYTRFPMDLLGAIGATPKSELLINFMVGFVHRFIERDGQQQSIRELYGLEVDEVLSQLEAGEDRIEQLVAVYERQLAHAATLPYTRRFYMVNNTGNISYALIHATGSETGVSRIKSAMWSVDPGGNFRFSDRSGDEPVLFVPDPDLRPLKATIIYEFAGRSGVTALSRIEGGQRTLKATELFAVADALGIDPSQLNPAAGGLYYEIQRQRLKYREATATARRSVGAARRLRDGLFALNLANEIQSGKTDFTVHGTPVQFVYSLTKALSQQDTDEFRLAEGEQALGLSHEDVQREYLSLTGAEMPSGPDDSEIYRQMCRAYGNVIARHFPSLSFTGEERAEFSVEGMTVDTENYSLSYMDPATLAEMLYGAGVDGR